MDNEKSKKKSHEAIEEMKRINAFMSDGEKGYERTNSVLNIQNNTDSRVKESMILNQQEKKDKKKDSSPPPRHEKEESIVDKYLFFLYAVIFIFLIYNEINIPLNKNCYTSLKRLFKLDGIQTTRQITPYDVVNSILDTVSTVSNLNWTLQVMKFFIKEKFQVISYIRINQRKVKLINNIDPYFANHTSPIWAVDKVDVYKKYDESIEEDYSKVTKFGSRRDLSNTKLN